MFPIFVLDLSNKKNLTKLELSSIPEYYQMILVSLSHSWHSNSYDSWLLFNSLWVLIEYNKSNSDFKIGKNANEWTVGNSDDI